MASRYKRDLSSRLSKSKSISSDARIHLYGVPFNVHRDVLAARSSRIAALIEDNRIEDIPHFLREIQADPETFELVARFCHGFELNLSSENVIPIICIAYHLGMEESYSSNNLLDKAVTFLEERVLPSWNESITCLRASGEHFLKQAEDLGLLNAFLDSIVQKALVDPRVLGEPILNSSQNQDGSDQPGDHDENNNNYDAYRPNARRRLFVLDWKSEDLTTLSLWLYETIIQAMNQHHVAQEYVAASVCNYAKRWIFATEDANKSGICKRKHQRDAIEAIDRLLPHQRGLVPCSFLFQLLQQAVLLESSFKTRNGFETRIGKQLDQATVKDVLIPSTGYAKEVQYDIECVRRILKAFYSNCKDQDVSGFFKVAKLIEEFLAELAAEADLKIATFISLAEMAVAASYGAQKYSDGIYRAVDIYLAAHPTLTESEKLEVCKVLDCNKLSAEACDHAANNQRLPLRVVVQVLFVSQLQLRDTIAKEVQGSDERSKRDKPEEEEEDDDEEEEENNEKQEDEAIDEFELVDDEAKFEMQRMNSKVTRLERECDFIKQEIKEDCAVHRSGKKGKFSVWGEVKRKFGCMTGVHECNCQVKKKKKIHPK